MTEPFLVDSHCHLDFPQFAGKEDEIIARAREAGVGVMQTIGTKTGTALPTPEVVFPRCEEANHEAA